MLCWNLCLSLSTRELARLDPKELAALSVEAPPTDYAKASIAEDFAESVALYVTDKAKLRKTAPKRYRVIDRLMKEDGYGG